MCFGKTGVKLSGSKPESESSQTNNECHNLFHGQIWRQFVPPILRVAGIHCEDQLVELHLQSNAGPPILKEVVDELHIPREIDKEILPLVVQL